MPELVKGNLKLTSFVGLVKFPSADHPIQSDQSVYHSEHDKHMAFSATLKSVIYFAVSMLASMQLTPISPYANSV